VIDYTFNRDLVEDFYISINGRPLAKGPTTRVMTRRIQKDRDSVDLSRPKLLSSWARL